MLGTIEPVTAHTKLINPADCRRIIVSVDAELGTCSRDQSTSLVAELLGAYPGIRPSKADPKEVQTDFGLYVNKLHEAMSEFSFAIGKAIVNGGSGVPAICPYKPKPADIVAFGNRERDKRLSVKTMALRHIAEAQRRQEEKAREAEIEKSCGTLEDRRRTVAAAIASFKAMPVVEPVAPRGPRRNPHQLSPDAQAHLDRIRAERLSAEAIK